MRKIEIDKEYLIDRYVVKNMTLKQIGEELGVNRETVSNKLKEFNIPKRVKIKKVKSKKEIPPYRIKEEFEKVYSELGSLDLVAKYFGINITTVCDWKNKLGIKSLRKTFSRKKKLIINKPYANKEWLIKMYNKYSSLEIAEKLGCHPTTIQNWLRKFNIPIRSLSEQWKKKPKVTAYKIIGKFKVRKNSGYILKALKRDLLNFYGCCESCGESEVLDIHHIDFNHSNNSKENLSVLCPNCHAKIHRNGVKFYDLVKNHKIYADAK